MRVGNRIGSRIGKRIGHRRGGLPRTKWTRRKPITITNSGSAIADYQQLVTIGYDSEMKADFSDIRFRASDGTTELPFWLESKTDSATAVFYVKVPAVAGSGDTTIYCYYGNTAATDASTIANTFSYSEDFEGVFGTFKNGAKLDIPTYDGSGQCVHPDVLYFPNGWNSYKYWMAFTPHPGSNDDYENPSIVVSNDAVTWAVPSGLTNPIVPYPGGDGHNFDPCLFYNSATDELWMYYMDRVSTTQKLYRKKSSDGITWAAAETLLTFDTAVTSYVTPSVAKVDGTYYLWLQHAVADTVFRRWDSADGATFENMTSTTGIIKAGHVSIKYIQAKSKYIALVAESNSGGNLLIYSSEDGLTWAANNTQEALCLRSGDWDANMYQSSLVYYPDTDECRLFYSAYESGPIWRIGLSPDVMPYSAMMDAVNWTNIQGTGTFNRVSSPVKRGVSSIQFVQISGTSKLVRSSTDVLAGGGNIISADFYDDMDSTSVNYLRLYNGTSKVGLGISTLSSTTKYVYHDKSFARTITAVDRSLGWHKMSIAVKSDQSIDFFIDNQSVGTLAAQFADAKRVEFAGDTGNPSKCNWDDIRQHKYVATVPSVVVGAEESL